MLSFPCLFCSIHSIWILLFPFILFPSFCKHYHSWNVSGIMKFLQILMASVLTTLVVVLARWYFSIRTSSQTCLRELRFRMLGPGQEMQVCTRLELSYPLECLNCVSNSMWQVNTASTIKTSLCY